MTIDRLSLYKGACRIVGTSAPATLTEATETRRILDDVWDDGALDACLEEGLWNFALRTISINYDQSVTPNFGFSRAFSKPTDWIRTECVASDENFINRLTDIDYRDEANYWWSYIDTIFVRHVSNDALYGANYANWPESFNKFVQSYLAFNIVGKLRDQAAKQEEVEKFFKEQRLKARSKDAMNEGVAFTPAGTWVRSRLSRRSRGDRGSWSRLIG